MMNNISWGSYCYALTILLIIYYVYVWFRFYRANVSLNARKTTTSPTRHSEKEINIEENEFADVRSLTDEVSAYLEQASQSSIVKNELISGLQQIASKHIAVKNTPFQTAVDSLIQFECKDKCGIHLSEEEVRHVWIG